MDYEIKAVAFVKNSRTHSDEDNWGSIISEIELVPEIPQEAFENIEMFSHLHVIFLFHLLNEEAIHTGARHPRENLSYPRMGIFAQRPKMHPNRLGLTAVKLLRHEGRKIWVEGLDALNATPVIDIKPVMKEFSPREETVQPAWVSDMLGNYWKR